MPSTPNCTQRYLHDVPDLRNAAKIVLQISSDNKKFTVQCYLLCFVGNRAPKQQQDAFTRPKIIFVGVANNCFCQLLSSTTRSQYKLIISKPIPTAVFNQIISISSINNRSEVVSDIGLAGHQTRSKTMPKHTTKTPLPTIGCNTPW